MRRVFAAPFVACALVAAAPHAHARQRPAPAANPSAAKQASNSQSSPVPAPSADELPRGRVVERVATRADAAQTYALYLPSNYTPERRWPILYCFDPGARGGLPVERFSAAAERYGWIVVGSNNSRNGPLKPSIAATAAMWDDTHARLSIDERRVYTAGFSGGARNAVRVGYLCRDCLAGVVAVGAGFPVEITPDAKVPFPVFALAGTNDFNFPELRRLDETLDRFSLPHRFEVFDGGHEWAPAERLTQGVEWMELQAMKSGRRPKDDGWLDALWLRRTSEARSLEEANRPREAYGVYRSLAADFAGLRDVSEVRQRASRLRETKEVRRALEEEGAEVSRQQRRAAELVALVEKRQDPEEGAIAAVDFRRAVADLRKAARAEADTGERRVARRVLHQVFARYYEGALNLRAGGGNLSLAAATLEIAAEVSPDNPGLLYELACTYALNRDRRKAVEALRRAVEKGFRDAARLASDPDLKSVQSEPEYREILDRLNKQQGN